MEHLEKIHPFAAKLNDLVELVFTGDSETVALILGAHLKNMTK